MNSGMNRRKFIKTTSVAAAGMALAPSFLWGESAERPGVLVVHGQDVQKMLEAGIAKLGGWSAWVNKGRKVTIKPNAAWASRPEEGGNTDPLLVGALVKACQQAGASEVVLPENPCADFKRSFAMSGIADAVKAAGGKLYRPGKNDYREVRLPRAKTLKTARVAVDVLDTDVLINVPVAKSHGGAVLTLSMKNWMGSVEDRGFWHRNQLHQCIADLSTLLRPHLIVVDATRIMTTHGPRGPGDLEYPHQLIFGRDPVAVDAVAATLFKKKPFDIPHIRIAHEMGVGCGLLEQLNITHLET